jgi:hypothetical protein
LLLAGCGGIFAPQKPQETQASPAKALGVNADRMSMEAKGVDLRLFDSHPSVGEDRKPTLWLHADMFTLEEENISSFRNARAIVYGKNDQSGEITLEAGAGRCQESKMAYLTDGVKAHVADMTLELEDFEWINDSREGKTDHPVKVNSPTLRLTASSMRLYPDARRIELVGVSGSMRIEGINIK